MVYAIINMGIHSVVRFVLSSVSIYDILHINSLYLNRVRVPSCLLVTCGKDL